MKKITNIIILSSVFLVISGIIVFVVLLSIVKNNDEASAYRINTYQMSEEFVNITVNESISEIDIVKSNDNENKVVVREHKNMKHSVVVNNGTLEIKVEDNRKWYDKIFSYLENELTIYLTDKEYENLLINSSTGDIKVSDTMSFKNIDITASTADIECYADAVETIKIHVSTGDIEINDLTANNIDLKVTTGDVEVENINCYNEFKIEVSTGDTELDNITCNSFSSTGSTGSIQLDNVIVTLTMQIKRSTGDVRFNKCDAKDIIIETSTGDVKGSLLTNKIFECETDTGKKQVPSSSGIGTCKITCDTGDIIIEVIEK